MEDEHASHCKVWEWITGTRYLNNVNPCTCGYRDRQAEERAKTLTRYRPLRPLGMSEHDWLRTNGIKPEL